MKLKSLLVLAILATVSACAAPFPVGVLYTEVTTPVTATANGQRSPKKGTAECKSILSLVATGDCSIQKAKANGGITKVDHIDWEAKNILGIIGEYKVNVYGR